MKILRHNYCDGSCRFYHKWAHAYFFTFLGIRIVIGKPRSDTNEEKWQKFWKEYRDCKPEELI